MNVLRPPVKTVAKELSSVYGEDNVRILNGILGTSIEIKCPRPETWAVVGFSRRIDCPECDLHFFCRPSAEWRFDDTDFIDEDRERFFDYSSMTTKQLVESLVKAI